MTKTKVALDFTFRPIGQVRTEFAERFATPRQGDLAPSSRGWIELNKELSPREFFREVEGFSHIWLIWVFDQNPQHSQFSTVRPPRRNGETVGVFASRSPMRPNPIGLSLVKNLRLDSQLRLQISGVDLIDRTPILDIKPYVKADRPDVFAWGWPDELNEFTWKVDWAEDSRLIILAEHKSDREAERVISLVEESLVQDPRPLAFKKWADHGKEVDHVAQIAGFDIHFRFNANQKTIFVFRVTTKRFEPRSTR